VKRAWGGCTAGLAAFGLLCAGAEEPSPLKVFRVEFWCTTAGWEPRRPVRDDAPKEPVYTKFLAWDTAAEGIHPDAFDVAVYVAHESGPALDDVTVTLRERRLVGPVIRVDEGEFRDLIDRGSSRAEARWLDGPGRWTHKIKRIEPGARKKIIFHGVTLGKPAAELRTADPFCWKVEYVAELTAADGFPLGAGSAGLEVARED